MNAITPAVRNRKRTWPSVFASRNARTSATGRTTSWIHRGIWIVGPGPAMRRIVPSGLRERPSETLLRSVQMATTTPRSRHAARLRADRRRAQARARRFAIIARHRASSRSSRSRSRRSTIRAARPAVSRPRAAPGHLRAARPPHPRDRREPPRPVARRAGRRHRDRLPRERGRRARPEAGRPAGRTKGSSHGCGAASPGRPGAVSPGTSSRVGRSARSTSARSPGPTSTRPWTGPSSRFATRSSPAARSAPRSSCARRPRRRSSSRSRTSEPDPALTVGRERRRGLVEARHGRRTSAASSSRRSSAMRPTAGTTSRSRCSRPPPWAFRRVLDLAHPVHRRRRRRPRTAGARRSAWPRLRSELEVDACVVNGENAADGIGITPRLADQILAMGVDAITLGNHAFRRSEIGAYLDASDRVIRPANTSRNTPGRGVAVVPTANGGAARRRSTSSGRSSSTRRPRCSR